MVVRSQSQKLADLCYTLWGSYVGKFCTAVTHLGLGKVLLRREYAQEIPPSA